VVEGGDNNWDFVCGVFVWLENLSLHMGGFMVEKERGLELWVGGGVATLE